MPGLAFEAPREVTFAAGDMLVLVTDGFFEWANSDREPFGLQRLYQVIRESRDLTSEEIIKALYDKITSFVGGLPQDDDLTAVIIKKL